MKRICLVFLLCNLIGLLQAENPSRIRLISGGYQREYLLYLPKQYNEQHPADHIIICLHGFNRTVDDFFANYNIASLADSLNLIVLAPQALPEKDTEVISTARTLSYLGIDIPLEAAWGCGLRVKARLGIFPLLDEELNKQVDDVSLIREIIEKTYRDHRIRSSRPFLFGTSMGGFMAYQYALSGSSGGLAGLISVCGSMGTSIRDTQAEVKVPVCDFHSLKDEVVPYSGETVKSGAIVSLCQPKEAVLDFWVRKNKASLSPQTEDICYYPSENGITVKKKVYPGSGCEVIHYQIDGASHNYYFRKSDGDCMDYNEEIFKFIKSHSSDTGTGLENPNQDRIVQVYPNPVTDELKVIENGKWKIENVEVFDSGGKIIYRNKIEGDCIIPVSGWSKGVYFIRIYTNSGVRTEKIMKN